MGGAGAVSATLARPPGHALAERLFDRLREATGDGVGITRESYGAGESLALDIVEAEARAQGLDTARDAGPTSWSRSPEATPPCR